MYYTGAANSGHAIFVMSKGVISGADATGGILDGIYEDTGDGHIDVSVTLTSLPGTSLATGATVGREPLLQEISARLPENLGNGRSIGVQTPTGPVNVAFKRLRDIP